MRILYAVLLFISLLPLVQGLKCWSGHSQSPTVCTSLTYCVTMRSKSGPTQHSCDGNAVGQISLCSVASSRNRMGSSSSNGEYFYSGQSSSRSSRTMTSDQKKSCFDGGDLGQICCCSADFCNAATGYGSILATVVGTIVVLF